MVLYIRYSQYFPHHQAAFGSKAVAALSRSFVRDRLLNSSTTRDEMYCE